MAIPSNLNQKTAFRQEARSRLATLDPLWMAVASGRIVAHLARWLEATPERKRVAIFAALPGEPDLSALADRARSHDYCYPLVWEDYSLTFHLVSDRRTLVPGGYRILEPNPQVHPAVLPEALDALLCPALAFAGDGTRLGRGKGFYDRALARAAPGAARVGVGFARQCLPGLPRDPHDVVMTHLVDEEGMRPVPASPGSAT